MTQFPKDIYTEPTPDANTLANLGPLAPTARTVIQMLAIPRGSPRDHHHDPRRRLVDLRAADDARHPGQSEPFAHTDRNTLVKIGEPVPNPTARAA